MNRAHPGAVLVGAGLHRDHAVEQLQVLGLGVILVRVRRVVAEHQQLHALQRHDPVGLRPAAIVADAHAHHPPVEVPDREAEVADLEVVLLEVLER